jgi:hypothetical protein
MRQLLIVAGVAFFLVGCQSMNPSASKDPSLHVTILKDQIKWMDGPSALPPGAKLAVLEGDPSKPGFFTMRAILPANYRVPPHFHPQPERLTILSGTLYLGDGDEVNEISAKALPPGAYTSMPAGMHHYAFTKEECIIQLSSMGPWGITYLNPADDPRKSAK